MDTVRDIVVFCGRPIYFAYQEIRSEATICDGILHIPSNTFKGLAKGLNKSNLAGKVTWVLGATLAAFLGIAVLNLAWNSCRTSTVRPPEEPAQTEEQKKEATRTQITTRMQKPVLTAAELQQIRTNWIDADGCQEDGNEIMKKFALCESLIACMDDQHQIDSLAQAIESARESFTPAGEGEADPFQLAVDAHKAHAQARKNAEDTVSTAMKSSNQEAIARAQEAFLAFEGIDENNDTYKAADARILKLVKDAATPKKNRTRAPQTPGESDDDE